MVAIGSHRLAPIDRHAHTSASGEPEESGGVASLMAGAADLRYSTGETIGDIAGAFSVDWTEAASWLRAYGTFGKGRRVLAPAQVTELEARVLDNGSPTRVAQLLGLSVDELSVLLGRRKRPADQRGNLTGLTAQHVDDIVARYTNGGESTLRLAGEYGVTAKTIDDVLTGRGVVLRADDTGTRNGASLSDQDQQRIVDRYREGISVPAIAQEMSLSYSTVRGTLQDRHVLMASPEDQLARLGPDRVTQILARCADDVSTGQVATEFGLLPRTVRLVLQEHQTSKDPLNSRPTGRPENKRRSAARTDPRLREMQERAVVGHYRDGMTPLEISSRFGMSEASVTLALRRHGLLPPEPGTHRATRAPAQRRATPARARRTKPTAVHTSPDDVAMTPADFLVNPAGKVPPVFRPPVPIPTWSDAPAPVLPPPQSGPIAEWAAGALAIDEAAPSSTSHSEEPPRRRGRAPVLSDADIEMVVAFYQDGETLIELAETFGVHQTTISRILRSRHITRSRKRVAAGSAANATSPAALPAASPVPAGDGAAQSAPVADAATTTRPAKPTSRLLTDEQADQIAERYVAGASLADLGRQFGVSSGPIISVLDGRNIPRRKPTAHIQRALTAEQVREVITRYQAGESTRQLGDAFGVNRATIGRALTDAHVPLRQPARSTNRRPVPPQESRRGGKGQGRPAMRALTEEEGDAVVLRYRDGAPIARIASEFAVGATAVRSILERRGIPRRPQGRQSALSRSQAAVAFARSRAGASHADIARGLQVSTRVVAATLDRLDEQPPTAPPAGGDDTVRTGHRPRKLSQAEIDEVVYQFVDETPLDDIADEMQVDAETVITALEARGVPRRALIR